ncbi:MULTISPECIES: methyltransferase domain-containing protein [unclassified Campylobacter]|uniref:methyltransferase domain-containing protein n=1 Tax=unclassified Campylobacter TaxID=2593542 RepID=UPI001237B53F|nr:MULTISPECIES: methyltransferase domain-containing protein [unclassified Campylobacter]KAA6226476.1 methyltransferase domain-containing protein [Campylobacter sp. LR185c]KAA6228611.1 methyltransferase domain-containing protein [Campylobacter sp. LR196d]KAA6229164.1 methyltransferase domain-containing protein [Campylobacter sp. LR286c]KAA6233955.1 methyltransferase domain-containing protein [Campylobacter sp. LR291e]KAA6234194.1 methyltransferase domain-containing protein [Campylobacter sp. L
MNFLKAKKSYETNAIVQAKMADLLCELLQKNNLLNFDNVFEFGAGQGEFSKKIQKIIKFKRYIKNDCLDYGLKDAYIFDMNDIKSSPLSKQKFDLITSNACLQWLNIEKILPTLTTMLNKNGLLLLSSFGKKNLEQIKLSTNLGLKYLSLKEYEILLKKNFDLLNLSEKKFELEFDSALSVFRHLKLNGTNSFGPFFLSKKFLKDYEKRFKNKLSYHCIFILCKYKINKN